MKKFTVVIVQLFTYTMNLNLKIANFFRKHSALKGSTGVELDERLLKVNNVYFSKNKANAFSNPELTRFFNGNGIKEIHIVGLFTEGCSLHNNFHTTVVKDAVAGSSDKKRLIALNKLRSNKVKVIDSFQLLEML